MLWVKSKKHSRLYELNFGNKGGTLRVEKKARAETKIIIVKQHEKYGKMLIVESMWWLYVLIVILF